MSEDNNPYDDSYDQIPGNARMSPEYARQYDDQNEFEWHASGGLENAHQLAIAHEEQRIANALRASRMLEESAGSRIQIWPHVGKFVIPNENTYQAHFQLVQGMDAENDLHFNPDHYQFFDRRIAGVSGRNDLFDPSHPEYAQNENLRDNLAVLRNDIMGIYMNDASYDPGDEGYIPHIMSMADEIGLALKHEKEPLSRIYQPYLSTDMLNILGDGAAYTYRYLLKQQDKQWFMSDVTRDLKQIFGMKIRDWYLPPIEHTAFHDEALNATPPRDVLSMTDEELAEYVTTQAAKGIPDRNLQSLIASAGLADKLNDGQETLLQKLSAGEKQQALQDGITILEWLKNIQLSEKSVEEMMTTGTPQEQAQLVSAIPEVLERYTGVMAVALQQNPELRRQHTVQQAEKAAEVLDQSVRMLSKPQSQTSLPPAMEQMKQQSFNQLVRKLSDGVATVTQQTRVQGTSRSEVQPNSPAANAALLTNQQMFLSDTLRRDKDRRNPFARKIDDNWGQGGHQGRDALHGDFHQAERKSEEASTREDVASRYRDIDADGIADVAGQETSSQRQQRTAQSLQDLSDQMRVQKQQPSQPQQNNPLYNKATKAKNPLARKIDDNWGQGGHQGRDFLHGDHRKHNELLRADQRTGREEIDERHQVTSSSDNRQLRDKDGDGIADRAGEMTSSQRRDLGSRQARDAQESRKSPARKEPLAAMRQPSRNDDAALQHRMAEKRRTQEENNLRRKIDGNWGQGDHQGRDFIKDGHQPAPEQASHLHKEAMQPASADMAKLGSKGRDIDGDGRADKAGEMSSIGQKDLDMIRMLGKQIQDAGKEAASIKPAAGKGASPVDESFASRTQSATDPNKNKLSF